MFYRQSRANLGYVAILSNADVCTVTMGVACPLLRRSIIIRLALIGRNKVACAPSVV